MASLIDALRALTPVKPGDDVAEVASADRMNAIMDAIRALCRGDNIGKGLNILKKSQDGWVILSGQPGGVNRGGGGEVPPHPFQVTTSTNDDNAVVATIYPGMIENQVPELGGVGLDADDPPELVLGGGSSILLHVFLDGMSTLDFRTKVDTVNVIDGVVTDAAPEMKITWTDERAGKGHFKMKIADYSVTYDADSNPTVTITQYLFQSVRTLIVCLDQALMLA